ncbi:MAG: methyltransferase domain-containing protein [Candidatus Rokubacteria bacterium]|nr:methyltransferase domain-containing protein [Candidatus Rokubacteria bacterium]
MTTRSSCPACLGSDVSVFLEIERVPTHCHVLRWSRDEAAAAPRGDIRLGHCRACGLIFNVAFDPERMSYAGAYENSLAWSPRFSAYARGLATRLIARHDVRGKRVVEIGCGQGDFLALLCAEGGNRGIGFDPCETAARGGQRRTDGVTIVREPYSAAAAGGAPDFVCCRHVLEHIASPREFLVELRASLGTRADTVVFFEVPNALATFEDLAIWDIIYEHCSYFTATSLRRVFEAAGFAVLDIRTDFEEQFLSLEAVPVVSGSSDPMGDLDGSPKPPRRSGAARGTRAAPRDRARPLIGQLDGSPEPPLSRHLRRFQARFRHTVRTWDDRLRRQLDAGSRVVVWGAGSKAVTFLNVVPSARRLEYVVDINSRKRGAYVPGTGQQMVGPDFLLEHRPDVVLVMNPAYAAEIRQAMAGLGITADLIDV